MTDQKIEAGDEYHYPDEEYVIESKAEVVHDAPDTVEQPVMKEASSLKRFMKQNKRKLFVVLIIMIALIGLQITKQEKNNKVIVQQPAPAVTVAPSQPSATEVALTQALSQIQQDNNSNSQQIAALKNQLDDMRDQMQQSNQTNDQLKQAMVLLLQELKNINENMNQKGVVKPSGPPKPKVVYFVRAVIDGRAWIIGSNGLTESVTMGDPIPNYGLVKEIDPARGMIVTTSGKTLKLGLNDF